ncbi:hypothetical protein SODALDRAFT_313717 [Sodiomyces alkalinus F11]|uniref:Hydantoin racemase n=1 Tax=Sodiomyces alkalinus (strain CBS 110278 / VKM F-3762 / F11) TaxID=1314773 RepID=A0A3N2PSI7_SODAK|nr:hypothetical protein SODALDRAFT_313717 [Sodiomyces alkalinus F11]ROT37489.1 hypothetical protein SODALDRAFT_313717 [Sodiomyces alkalinus F11]
MPGGVISILVVNPNSSHAMTQGMEDAIKGIPLDESIKVYTYTAPPDSPASINDAEGIQISTDVVLKDLAQSGELEKYDGILVACYSVHPLVGHLAEQYKNGLSVTGIFEASILTATSLLPPATSGSGSHQSQWGIVTTGAFWEEHLGTGVREFLGQESGSKNAKFRGVASTGLSAGDFHHVSAQEVKVKLEEATRRLLGDGGVSCVVMGCAGMAGLEEIIRTTGISQYGTEAGSSVLVVDGVKAGILQLEQMVKSRRLFSMK